MEQERTPHITGNPDLIAKIPVIREAALEEAAAILSEALQNNGVPPSDAEKVGNEIRNGNKTRRQAARIIRAAQAVRNSKGA